MNSDSSLHIDETFMHRALELAQMAAEQGEVPVGAVVVKDGEIIGEGFNSPIGSCDPSAHAEVRAIRAAASHMQNYRLPGTTLYVTIEPCAMCLGTIVHARINRIVFGATEPKAGCLVSNPGVLEHANFNHSFDIVERVLEDECSTQISTFFQRRRKEKKCHLPQNN